MTNLAIFSVIYAISIDVTTEEFLIVLRLIVVDEFNSATKKRMHLMPLVLHTPKNRDCHEGDSLANAHLKKEIQVFFSLHVHVHASICQLPDFVRI